MKIAVCGSISYFEDMKKIARKLKTLGFEKALLPIAYTTSDHKWKDNMTVEESANRKIALDLIKKHYRKILEADCILVVNKDKNGIANYIGGNTFLEMGFAFVLGKPIFLMNPVPEMLYQSEMKGMKPIILNNDLDKVKEYYHL